MARLTTSQKVRVARGLDIFLNKDDAVQLNELLDKVFATKTTVSDSGNADTNKDNKPTGTKPSPTPQGQGDTK